MKKQVISRLAAVAVLAAGSSLAAQATERSTPREAHAMFEQAVRYMEENGPERAFAAFNDR
jgi:cytochrome c